MPTSLPPTATGDERARLAGSLHDGLAQELAFLGYQIDRLITVLGRPAAGSADEGLASAQDLRAHVTTFLGDLRAAITELRTPVAPDGGPADPVPGAP